MQLPIWFGSEELEAWNGFCEMRKAMKRIPFTERAMKVTIKELERLRAKGENVADVLDQSTQRGWRGVFPVIKVTNNFHTPPPRSDLQKQLDKLMEKSHGNERRGQTKPH